MFSTMGTPMGIRSSVEEKGTAHFRSTYNSIITFNKPSGSTAVPAYLLCINAIRLMLEAKYFSRQQNLSVGGLCPRAI